MCVSVFDQVFAISLNIQALILFLRKTSVQYYYSKPFFFCFQFWSLEIKENLAFTLDYIRKTSGKPLYFISLNQSLCLGKHYGRIPMGLCTAPLLHELKALFPVHGSIQVCLILLVVTVSG